MKTNKYIQSWSILLVFLMVLGVGKAWGDETLTITGSIVGGSSSYSSSSATATTDNSSDVDVEWTDALENSTPLQLKASTGVFLSTSCPSGLKIKSIKISSVTNTMNLYCSSDGSSWSSALSYTDGTALDVASSNYKYFKVTATASYTKASSIIVVYTNTAPQTVTFNKQGGTFDDPSFDSDNTLTEASAGAGVTLPLVNPSSACASEGWKFYGWAATAVGTETATAPTIVGKAGDTYHPGATTLHAVFAKGEYTKITSTSGITSGAKYLIAGWYDNKVHVMTSTYTYTDDYYMKEKVVSEYESGKIHAAAVEGSWCYVITGSTNAYFIQNVIDDKYIDTYYTDWYKHDKDNDDSYTIGFSAETCYIKNNYSYCSYPYLVLFALGDFGTVSSEWAGMMLYKETEAPTYNSTPSCCDKAVAVSYNSAGSTHVSAMTFSETSQPTCSGTAGDREVTIYVTPSSGYLFKAGDVLTWTKSSGTIPNDPTLVSGPTLNAGKYEFVYRFAQDDNGAGTFSATASAYTNYRTQCCDDPELAFTYTGVATAEELVRENKARLDAADEVVLTYTTSSSGTITDPTSASVYKLSYGSRATEGGSAASAHVDAISIDKSTKKITLSIKTTSSGGNTGCGTYRVALSQAAYNSGGDNYCEKTAYGFVDVKIKYEFIDAVNGNTTVIKYNTGEGVLFPTEGELSGGTDCHSETRVLKGWISETKLTSLYGGTTRVLTLDDVKDAANTIVAPGADGKGIYAQGTKWYAVWAYER